MRIVETLAFQAIFFYFSAMIFSGAAADADLASPTTPARKLPNILWIIAENSGPDLGCYGTPLVQTPHLDRLAREGIRYEQAFATSPVCSPSRSAFMTGVYQTAIGAHNHRSHRTDFFPLPADVRPITHRLWAAGYHTANIRTMGGQQVGTGKTDLNFDVEGEFLQNLDHVSSISQRNRNEEHNQQNEARLFHSADWDDLRSHRPFFAQINLPVVELGERGWVGSLENPWYGTNHPSNISPEEVTVPPYYPDHPVTRREWANYLDAVCGLDGRVGEILERLAADGAADDTVVIFFADNGRLTLRGLDWCYDSGDRVPLIIRWPKNFPAPRQYRPGSVKTELVSLIDITATTLEIAGIRKSGRMHGRVILGPNADPPRHFVVSARDRCDESVNRIRALRTERYRYIRNLLPEKAFMALHRYKAVCYPVMRLMFQLHAEGKLTSVQEQLMAPRLADEELYDLRNDPHEVNNLAASPSFEHQRILLELRERLTRWMEETDDQGRYPESPGVVEYWTRIMDEQYGIPDWYQPPR